MQPVVSYKIWYSQRSGSTYLSEGMTQTGLAGVPGEYFEIADGFSKKYGAITSFEAFKNKVWAAGTSANGVFGIKTSLHKAWGNSFMEEMRKFEDFPDGEVEGRQRMEEIFPNCKHIFLTRRNKIRQAVSWWKAIKDEVWHLREGQSQQYDPDFFERNYDFDALKHLLMEIILKESALEAHFSQNAIQPLTVVYEDYIKDYQGTVKRMLNYLNIDFKDLKINERVLLKTANSGSELWVHRFKDDLQKGWEKKVW